MTTFSYYLWLGLRSLSRRPALTLLMILTLGAGVASSVSTLTVLHAMGRNPIPEKSERLILPLLNNATPDTFAPGEPDDIRQMTYIDVKNLLNDGFGHHKTAVYATGLSLETNDAERSVLGVHGLAVNRDYFGMFQIPWRFGSVWTAEQAAQRQRVIVLSRTLSERVFGSANPVGKSLTLDGRLYQVVGVIDTWEPLPRYTHLVNGDVDAFTGSDDTFIPFESAIEDGISAVGSITCHGGGYSDHASLLQSECLWLQLWYELDSIQERDALRAHLEQYQAEQKKHDRFPMKTPPQLYNVMEWLEFVKVVPNDTKLSSLVALGFLLLCIVNAIGLMLAKFSARAPEVGVRRSLGATRTQVLYQFLIEATVLGLAGGALGMVLSLMGLWLIGMQAQEFETVAHLDLTMVATAITLSVVSSLLAGLLPAWKASRVSPAMQLKAQ